MRRVAFTAMCAVVIAGIVLGLGAFRWGGQSWNRTEGDKFTQWLNEHGATADDFATKHPDLAATFGARWPDRTVELVAGRINSVLAAYESPMVGEGEAFARAGKDWNINPFLVASLAGMESTFGRHPCSIQPVNVFGWESCKRIVSFVSYKHAIFVVTRALRRSYLDKGYVTLDAVADKYCACGPRYAVELRKVLKLFGSSDGLRWQAAREAVL